MALAGRERDPAQDFVRTKGFMDVFYPDSVIACGHGVKRVAVGAREGRIGLALESAQDEFIILCCTTRSVLRVSLRSSEERRVVKECGGRCSSRKSQYTP